MTEDASFGIHENSIIEKLMEMPREVQVRYRINRAIYEGDRQAMEAWAAGGFTSMIEQLED